MKRAGSNRIIIWIAASTCLLAVATPAGASVLYGIEAWGQERLITIDRSDATVFDVGPFNDVFGPFGMAYDLAGDTLFLSNRVDDRLYTVDQLTGAATPVGNEGDIGADQPHGLAYDPNADVLYMSDVATNQLFSVDPDTGVGTLIGPFGGPFGQVEGLGFDPVTNTLFGLMGINDELITIDTSTGAASTLFELPSGDWNGLTYDGELDVLWATNEIDLGLYRIDHVAMTADFVGSTLGSGSSSGVHGLAFKIPEPATGVLLGAMMACAVGRRRCS